MHGDLKGNLAISRHEPESLDIKILETKKDRHF